MKEFTFGVLSFNHESYIIEHLESIKYLIERHGSDIFVDLVINDDCSRDKTTILIDKWLGFNSHFFRNVNKIFNNKNIGTCQSFLNIVRNTKTDALKITAGDDVYSCENLFEYGVLPEDVSILSGIPLNIIDGEIIKNNRELLGVYLSREIYKDKNYLDRFKGLSNNNAPNIFYNKSNLTSLKFESFIVFLLQICKKTTAEIINRKHVMKCLKHDFQTEDKEKKTPTVEDNVVRDKERDPRGVWARSVIKRGGVSDMIKRIRTS